MSPAKGQAVSSIGVEIPERLERLVARSPADSTEVTWLETLSGTSADRAPAGRRERTVAIRVREAGRTGFHQTGVADPGELDNALRTALAQARLAPRSPDFPLAPRGGDAQLPAAALFDPEIAELDAARARAWLERCLERQGTAGARLDWSSTRLAFAHSRGASRQAVVTAAALAVENGPAGVARTLTALAEEGVAERARERAAGAGEPAEAPPSRIGTLVLAPEAAARFLAFFNRQALSAESYRSGLSPLYGRLGESLFPDFLTLTDDPTAGLPFPFDFSGWPKQRVTLIDRGVFATPAIDFALSQELARAPTRHAVSLDEAIASHLVLEPGAESDTSWLADLEDGVWAGSIAPPEAFCDRRGLCFRTVLQEVRRLDEGRLGPRLPDLSWEAELAGSLARVRKVGAAPVAVLEGGGRFGATTTPMLALALNPGDVG